MILGDLRRLWATLGDFRSQSRPIIPTTKEDVLQEMWMTVNERIENQGTQTLAVWMFIELLARMCNVLRLGSEVCN